MYKTNVKSYLKYLMLLLILPVAFMFAACDQLDSTATIDKSGNYQAAESSTLTETLGEQTTVDQTNGYRLTSKMETKGISATLNAIITKTGMAAKINGKVNGENKELSLYFTDGKLYMAGDGNKIYITYPTFDPQTIFSQYGAGVNTSIDIASIVASIDGQTKILEKAGNNFRIKMENQVVYFNFNKDGKLVALQNTIDTENGKGEITISSYDGEISFPNFSDYKSGADILD